MPLNLSLNNFYWQEWVVIAVPAAVVLLASLIGFRDVLRFSLYRVRAIASVCFAESIRRRVLLVTPVAMLGVVVVSQLQHPADEQDAIRQTMRFCLFAAGLVSVLAVIILACSNLPREIENRVIFTIVTKPTSRLEIILGKILGFTGVSATVLILMGLFTWGYLEVRATQLERGIAATLDDNKADPTARMALEHYRRVGLLTASRTANAARVAVLSEVSAPDDTVRWIATGQDGDMGIPFQFDPESTVFNVEGSPGYAPAGMVLTLNISARPSPTFKPVKEVSPLLGGQAKKPPAVQVQVLDELNSLIVEAKAFGGGTIQLSPDGTPKPVIVVLAPQYAGEIAKRGRVLVSVSGVNPEWQYGVGDDPVHLAVLAADRQSVFVDLKPGREPGSPTRSYMVFRGRDGRGGQQVRGQPDGKGPVAVYSFRHVNLLTSATDPLVPLEFITTVERSGADSETDTVTDTRFEFVNIKTGKTFELHANPETRRQLFLEVPRDVVEGGDFDVRLTVLSDGHWVTANPGELQVVTERQPFVYNLLRSLLVLWLLTVLVIAIAVFCSTFLSWPIAVVLTIVILLGRWGVVQLGDALEPGVGRTIVTSAGVNDPRVALVMSKSVEGLASLLKTTASFLPDVSQFEATGAVERGAVMETETIFGAMIVLGIFGLPLTALAYLIFRKKEVAP